MCQNVSLVWNESTICGYIGCQMIFSARQQITWPLRWMLSLRVKEFYPWELDWGPSGCRQLLSPGHLRSVSACLIWALKNWQFTHVRSQIPGVLPSATHSHKCCPHSHSFRFLLIWSQITSRPILKLSLRGQTYQQNRSNVMFYLYTSKALLAFWQYHKTLPKEHSCYC